MEVGINSRFDVAASNSFIPPVLLAVQSLQTDENLLGKTFDSREME